MDLRIFNDLPDTTTPLNADNLNYNFLTIDSEISNMHPVYEYTLTPLTTATSGSWQPLALIMNTDVIPKGKYLIMFSSTIVSNISEIGIGTINPYLDGARTLESTRQTIPIGKSLNVTGQSIIYEEFAEDSFHNVGIYVYASQNITKINAQTVKFIRIG